MGRKDANPFWPHVFDFQGIEKEHYMQCESIRKKGSTDQCPTLALMGHTLCGRHARMKAPVRWADVHRPKSHRIAKTQALIRGWLLRKRLALGGPGVLCRKNLANDEELVTCVEKNRQDPFEYFGFEENGKVWWFDFSSLWRWGVQTHEPVNPYTKVALSNETRRRLRALWAYNQRHKLPTPPESPVFSQRLQQRWNVLCQLFIDNGFVDVHPNNFLNLHKHELRSMLVLLQRDVQVILRPTDPGRGRILRLCSAPIHSQNITEPSRYAMWVPYILMLILAVPKDPYVMTFSVLSALYRC
jgi:hypothetical protein